MRFIDLFAGIGGFHYGLSRVGMTCVYANEWDQYANSVYKKHYGDCDERDIKTVKHVPDHDLICAGFPCQSFSIAGKRGGFDDTRGTLFFEIARIAQQKRTPYLLLENVKGLLSHDHGRTFQTMLNTLDELGYDVGWQVLNSKYWVPQNRERVFIIGHIRGKPRPQIFPLGEGDQLYRGKKPQGQRQKEHSHALRATSYHGQKVSGETYIKVKGMIGGPKWEKFNESSRRVYDTDGLAPTVPTSAGGGHIPKLFINYGSSQDQRISTTLSQTLSAGHYNQPKVVDGMALRRLTPIECERLQGFPDNWTQYGHDGKLMSDTQRYKMCGNAVTTNVIAEIGAKLCEL